MEQIKDIGIGALSAEGRTSGPTAGPPDERPLSPGVGVEERVAATLGLAAPLPPTLTLAQVMKIYGIGRGLAYSAAADGSIPSRRVGHKVIWPTQAILTALGEQEQE